MEQPATQHTATPDPTPAVETTHRCRSRKRNGARCHLPIQDRDAGLCFVHAARVRKTTGTFDDTFDLSTDLFGPATPSFQSAEEINSALTNLVILVARGRLSPRRASVITYALSFILRGLQVIDHKAASAGDTFVIDIDSAVARRALANKQEREQREENVPR